MNRSDKTPPNHPLVTRWSNGNPLTSPRPPWLFLGHTPYLLFSFIGIIQSWGWKHFLTLGVFYLPYLLCIISWFIRQRKQEKILSQLLKREDIEDMEIENNPILGNVRFSSKSSSISKKSSSKHK